MPLNRERVRRCLHTNDLQSLFIEELGWDYVDHELPVTVGGRTYRLSAVAEKRGMVAYRCPMPPGEPLPDRPTRVKIERQAAKSVHQHLIVFLSAGGESQVWQWARRDPGEPVRHREQRYERGETGEALIQKLEVLAFSLDEEEGLTHIDVTSRVRAAFDVERVTRRFFDLFKKERDAFARFLEGLPDEDLQRWYVSVMLNRLMFIYFIQKKGLLDGDLDYLQHKLAQSKTRGADRYYRKFLCPLFFEGFARRESERSGEVNRLLGRVPYLDGGLFQRHQVEEQCGQALQIPDAAFERLYSFFDAYQWHLDDRPLRHDNEINPDVLGYIFEKYINQKEMGAYYTKEDITGYISQNTIIPFLLDRTRAACRVAFEGEPSVWTLLQENPDRYIYEAVRKGVELTLPAEIAAGLDDVSQRGAWNTPAPPEYALPTEIWREVVARRQRYQELRLKMVEGQIRQVNDLITCNLDIRQFAQDVIETAEGPELLRAFWHALEEVTVLDPTCGSGAFLFAALNILAPLYEACLDRMEEFVHQAETAGSKKYPDLRAVLDRIRQHPNRAYFICKTIIVNNLYGVDIMDEAVEICKLRLFLKLVAQVEPGQEIEPLPDIDFNVRAGNTLVGFVRLDEVQHALTTEPSGQMLLLDAEAERQLRRIAEEAEIAARAYDEFHRQQVLGKGAITARDKADLRARLGRLNEELNRTLARQYGVDPDALSYAPWLASHKPFHWLVDFYGIMQQGGFDVIIGNPPYVVYSRAKVPYQLEPQGFTTYRTGNLYAFVFERSTQLGSQHSRIGLIVQLSALSSNRMETLQGTLLQRGTLFALPFPRRPKSVFDGTEMPVAIILSLPAMHSVYITSATKRFYTSERDTALRDLAFVQHGIRDRDSRIAKIGSPLQRSIIEKVQGHVKVLETLTANAGKWTVYYQEACRYWAKARYGSPHFRRDGIAIPPPHGRYIHFRSENAAAFAACLMNSSLFYFCYSVFCDCEHVNDSFVRSFHIPNAWSLAPWEAMIHDLQEDMDRHAERKVIRTAQGHTIEYDEIDAGLSKAFIDEIDRALAGTYGLGEEETDFILNYDIKYRMGIANLG